MSTWSQSSAEIRRERFWRTKPQDPTRAHARAGVPYFRPGHGRVLMPDDFMPVGEHTSKHMRAVPRDYLEWVTAQPWSQHWPAWAPVADYLSRHPTEGSADTPVRPGILFLDRMRKWPTAIQCFIPGSAHLHTLPGHEDCLHAFAVGALGLNRQWYQTGKGVSLPHYDLTVSKHAQALQAFAPACVTLVTDKQLILHKDQWAQFFRSKPALDPTGLPPPEPRAQSPFQRINPQSDKWCPTTKQQLTQQAAERAVARKQAQPGQSREENPHYLRCFHCPQCHAWHLTRTRMSHLD